MQQSKDYDDALALVDAPIGETFLIIHILDGLNSEFKEIVVAVRACETFIAFKELHDKLQVISKEKAWNKTKQHHWKYSNQIESQ